MKLTERHIIKQNHSLYNECDKLCFLSKNLYNYANYIVRNKFIDTSRDENKDTIFLNYYKIRPTLLTQYDYTQLPRKVSNQILMKLDKNWKNNKSKYKGKPSLPYYKHKNSGRFVAIYERGSISTPSLKKGKIKLSQSNIIIDFINRDKAEKVNEVRIVPKRGNYYVIEIVYEVKEKELKKEGNKLAIDLGLNNLMTLTSDKANFKPFIVNGRILKSINQYYNKKLGKLKSELPKGIYSSKAIDRLTFKRNQKIEHYLHVVSRYVIDYCDTNNINELVIGYNKGWKQDINIGKRNNQNFVNVAFSKLMRNLSYKGKLLGINVFSVNESYTSKCSFLDSETIGKQIRYKGRRIKRGLFKSGSGQLINADVNGSLNILRKAFPKAFAEGIEGIAVCPYRVTSIVGNV